MISSVLKLGKNSAIKLEFKLSLVFGGEDWAV